MRFIFFATIMSIGFSTIANPVALPTIEISELFFDESNNWNLELIYYEGSSGYNFKIDSLFIYSSSDTARLQVYNFDVSPSVFVITNDSLDSNFNINRQGDVIKVISFSMENPFENILLFGNVAGAFINHPKEGQSICKFSGYFVKCNAPSIGSVNDSTGICGTLKGIVYDMYSMPVTNRTFRLHYPFETSEFGEFSTRVLSKPTTVNRLSYKVNGNVNRYVSIDEISYTMEPDSIIEIDIHLLDTLTSAPIPNELYDVPIKIYPNPVSSSEKLVLEIELPIITSSLWYEIVTLDGKILSRERVVNSKQYIDLPNTKGICVVHVLNRNRTIFSRSVLID